MRHRVLILALFVQFSLLCQEPKEENKKCAFQGQVVNAATGEPVRKADLTLTPMQAGSPGSGSPAKSSTYSGTTDADGKFSIENVEPGSYSLSAQKAGFIQGRYGARGAMQMGTLFKVTAGQVQKDLLFKLMPQGVISGRVLDDEGEPVQYAMVQIMTEMYLRGKRQMMGRSGSSTNDRGEYRSANLPPGKYIIMASPPFRGGPASAKPADGKPETGLIPVYYPGVTDLTQAARVELAPGAELSGHDLRLQRARVVRIKGKVVDGASGAPAKNVSIAVVPREGATMIRSGASVRGENSEFEVTNLRPGSYNIMVNSTQGDNRSSALQPVEVGDEDIEGLTVTITPPKTISGSVVVEGGEKVSLGSMRVGAQPASPMIFIGGSPYTNVENDGSFTLGNAPSAKVNIQIYGEPAGSYVKSIKLGGQEILGKELDWTGGVPAGPIQITLNMKGAQVTGSVEKDNAPVSGATVVLVPDESRRSISSAYRITATDQTGAFILKGVAPGEYKAFAWEVIDFGAYEDPEFLKPIESKGVKVKLDESGSQSLQLKVIPPSTQ